MSGPDGPVRLVGDKLVLREFTPDDCNAVQSYAGDPEVTRFTDWGPNTLDDTRLFLAAKALQSRTADRREFDLAVIDANTQDLIGGASLRVIDSDRREGDLGYVIHRAHWSLGYATEAAKLLLAFGFDQLDLSRISATCDPDNHASARVLHKAGMTFQGRITGHMLVRGAWRDSLLFVATGETMRPIPPLAEADQLSRLVIDDYVHGRWAALTARFDAVMRVKLTEEAIAAGWAYVGAMVGAYKGHGEPAAKRVTDEFTVSDTLLKFEAGDMVARITFRDDHTIAGLFLLNPAAIAAEETP